MYDNYFPVVFSCWPTRLRGVKESTGVDMNGCVFGARGASERIIRLLC